MRRRHAWAGGLILGIALMLLAVPARGVITALTPLSSVLKDAKFIFTANVEALDGDKLTLVLTADGHLSAPAALRVMVEMVQTAGYNLLTGWGTPNSQYQPDLINDLIAGTAPPVPIL